MKKNLLFIGLCLFSTVYSAQSFTDDFESYSPGNMLAATSDVWETWSGANGGADDVAVTNNNAHSGSNSIYFASTSASGGPADVVLPFPGELEVGQFNLEMWMYINAGTGAYFNLQEQSTIGTAWAADIYFLEGGLAQFTSGGALLLSCDYPEDAWFKLRMENDLSTNTWDIYIDDALQGSYANGSTMIASMDIYPLTGHQFYVDDVSYEFTPYDVPTLNGGVTNINNMSGGLAGQVVTPQVVIRNLGNTNITSFDLELSYNGTTLSQSVSSVNIASLAFYTVNFTETLTLAAGSNDAVATISNVNGNSADDVASDDVKTLTVNPIVPAAGKRVVAEEGTGTWCPWCVRGTVFMDLLSETYGDYYIGIAVHNADPMTVVPYDAAVSAAISGYPSGFVDRGPEYDPSQFEIPFLERIQVAPAAFIENGAEWNPDTRVLNVSTTTTFQQSVSGNYRIAVVLTEDEVTGTGSGWAQANAYAGGSNGDMGGYENLANPVPASQMVYNHVARALSPSFDGLPNAFIGAMNAGNASNHNFSFTLPADWEEDMMHIVAMVIAPDGSIDNAFSSSIQEAISAGFVQGTQVVSVEQMASPETGISVYPVPAADVCYAEITLERETSLALEVYSNDGRLITSRSYGQMRGSFRLPIHMSEMASGVYTLRIITGDSYTTRMIVKE